MTTPDASLERQRRHAGSKGRRRPLRAERQGTGRSRRRPPTTAPTGSACPAPSRPRRSRMAAVDRTATAIEAMCAARWLSALRRRCRSRRSGPSATGSYGVPGGTSPIPADIFAQTPRFERVEDYRGASGQVSVVAAPSQRFNLRAWVFSNPQREDRARYDDATYSSMDDPLVQGTFQSRERTTVTGSSALARLDLERFGWLRLAVNQRRESFDSSGVIRDVPASGTSGGGGGGGGRGGGAAAAAPATFDVRSFTIDRHVDVYSTGAEWQVRPVTRLGTVLGAALNMQQRPGGATETEPTWLAGVSYDATATLRLHASATRKIRVPSIDQLFNTSSGNPESACRARQRRGCGRRLSARDDIERWSLGVPDARARLHRAAVRVAVREPGSVPIPRRRS